MACFSDQVQKKGGPNKEYEELIALRILIDFQKLFHLKKRVRDIESKYAQLSGLLKYLPKKFENLHKRTFPLLNSYEKYLE